MRDGGEGEIKVSGGSLYSLTIDLCYAQLFLDQPDHILCKKRLSQGVVGNIYS